MKKRIIKFFIFFIILINYLILGHIFKFYIKCPIHTITGLYCPGCGITRMLYSIIKLDFYQAFRYNQLIFIMLPFTITLYIEDLYSHQKNKKSLYKKIPEYIWYIIIIILLIYGIIRNVIPYFAPTAI